MSARLLIGAALAAWLFSGCGGGGGEPTSEQLAAEQARYAAWLAENDGRKHIDPPPCDEKPEVCQ